MSCIWCGGNHSALEGCAEMYDGHVPLTIIPPEPPWRVPPPSVVAQVLRWVRHAAAVVAGAVRR